MASRFFLIVYGSQNRTNRPKFSHTYATFIEEPSGASNLSVPREFTISWLPADGVIDPFARRAEDGRNYTYAETIVWLNKAGSKTRWESPKTEIKANLFQAAEDRFQELASGRLRYKMVDNPRTRPHDVSNCIHAVADLSVALAELGMTFTGTLRGISASRFVYQYFWPYFLTHPSLPESEERKFEAVQRDSLQVADAEPSAALVSAKPAKRKKARKRA